MEPPRTQYARVGESAVAYHVFGGGPTDLLFPLGNSSQLDLMWELPGAVSLYRRLGEFCRVLAFDRRSCGLSDPLPNLGVGSIEDWVADCVAVLDAAGSAHAAVWGFDIAGPMSMLFAATHPTRVSAVILIDAFAQSAPVPDGPSWSPEAVTRILDGIWASWGSGDSVMAWNPQLKGDPEARRFWGRWERYAMAPGTRRKTMEALLSIDVRDAVASVQCPALIIQGLGNPLRSPDHGRWLAERLPDVRYIEMESEGYLHPFYGNATAVIEEMREFLTGERHAPEPDRVLSTVIFTDIVGSTDRAASLGDRRWSDLLDKHDEVARSEVVRGSGRLIKSTGDGILATFDGPARAVRAAITLVRRWRSHGIDVRVGIHTAELELRGDDVGGIAVHTAARIQALAGPGEILVSRTVKDLVAGSELKFHDKGTHRLKGVPDEWQLLSVEQSHVD